MPSTNRETVKNLCKSIITRLENKKAILLAAAEGRETVRQEVYELVGPKILTDEDLRNQTLEKIGASIEEFDDPSVIESPQYRTARSMVRKEFGDDELNGMFFQEPLKSIAEKISAYFMQSKAIEDVFEPDEVLDQMIVDIIRKFNPANMH